MGILCISYTPYCHWIVVHSELHRSDSAFIGSCGAKADPAVILRPPEEREAKMPLTTCVAILIFRIQTSD